MTGVALAACHDGSSNSPPPPEVEGPYASDDLWMCKPDLDRNYCLDADLDVTFIWSDTSFEFKEHEVAADPEFDCFYVYPTQDFTEEPGNYEDLDNVEPFLRSLYNQAARFSSLCNLYVPIYRQMTIGTYSLGEDLKDSEFYQLAAGDIDEAFSQYLKESGDRPFVLMGHSQGSHMLIELLQQRFDSDPALRERLISALLLGPVNLLEVPEGQLAGGSFENIPLCSHATDNACIVAYDSIAEGSPLIENRETAPCVNTTLLGGSAGVYEYSIFNTDDAPFPHDVGTQWIAYPEMHTARCHREDNYLSVGVVDNPPATLPLSPAVVQAFLGGSTLHQVDVNYAIGDLLRIVAAQADSRP